MNDLHDLMYEASDGDPNRPDDPGLLLRRGRRRVSRRRGATVVSGVAVASLAVAGGVAWLPGAAPDGTSGQPPVATSPSDAGDGAFERVEVSREEVGRRCTIALDNAYGIDGPLVVPEWTDDGPWFEGQIAEVSRAGDGTGEAGGVTSEDDGWRWTAGCLIPQADLVDQAGTMPSPLPDAGDDDAIRAGCGRYAGYDFTGWDVVTSAGSELATTAVLRSANGYVATCGLNAAPGGQGDGSYVGISRERPPETANLDNEYAVWFGVDQYAGDKQSGDYNVFGVDQVAGPEPAAQIVLVEPDGTEHVSEVAHNGWFAIAEDLRLEMNPHGVSPLRIKVLDADGNVLADYPDGKQSRECELYPDLCGDSKD